MNSIRFSGLLASVAGAAVALSSPAAAAPEQRREYHLPEQDLGSGLRTLGQLSGGEIMFSAEAAQGKRSPRLDGSFTLKEAVDMLLKGSGLVAHERDGSILIRERSRDTSDAAEILPGGDDIVVTGTRIRGAPPVSPVTIVRREEAQRSGQSDIGQVIRDLPQNFSGGTNPTIAGPGQGGTQNSNGSSALNLRGLGPDASLTLINGHRLAFDATSQGVDISAIPLAAIERIDVAADGASALYGSDAIGGVANVILRRKAERITTAAKLGAATEGGAVTQQYTIVGGPSWSSGSFMAAADYRKSTEVTGRQRSYTNKVAPDATMIAGAKQISLVMAGEQSITDVLKFEIDANYMHRSVPQCLTASAVAPGSCYDNGTVASAKIDSWSVSPSLLLDLSRGWEVRLGGTYSQSKTKIVSSNRANGVETVVALPRYDNTLKTIELGAEGPLFSLPGGTARAAFGAGYRSNTLDHDLKRRTAGVISPVLVFNETRNVVFAYSELFLPFVSPTNAVPLVDNFQIVGALRYEDHHGVDRVTTPKIGVVYSPFGGLEIKANWGKSFKAPTLYQLGQTSSAQLVPAAIFSPAAPSALPVLYLFGGNPNLTPERATTWNVTAVVSPVEGLRGEISYFHIAYKDRVAAPVGNVTTAFQPVYSNLVQLNPSAQDVLAAVNSISGVFTNLTTGAFNPAAVSAIFRNYLQNVSVQSAKGVDIALSYTHDFGKDGALSVKGAATYIDGDRQITPSLPVVPQAGIVFTPAHWRGRINAAWDRDDLAVVLIGNYVGPTKDNRFNPVTTIGAFATLDAVLTVKSGRDRGLLSDIQWQVAVQNLFNKAPAIIRPSSAALPPYDSLNQSPLGRVINLTLTKEW